MLGAALACCIIGCSSGSVGSAGGNGGNVGGGAGSASTGGSVGSGGKSDAGGSANTGGNSTGGNANAGGRAMVDGSSAGTTADANESGVAVVCADITAAVLANQNVTLSGDSCIDLPAQTTQYDGVLSGEGTLRLRAPNGPGTLVVTADSSFTLPATQQTETAFETKSPTDPDHYFTIQCPNPQAIFVDPGATLQLGNPEATTGTIGNYIPNTNGTTINLDNMEVNGTLVLPSGPVQHLGILSGAGVIRRPAVGSAGGTMFLVGDNSFSGVYSQLFGGYFGSDHVLFSLPSGRVAPGRFLPGAPMDPDVQVSRIRLFETGLRYATRMTDGATSG